MPVGQQFDVQIAGKGYMLARGQFKGRAWQRTGLPNAVQPRASAADSNRNALQSEVDFVATYDDVSGGFGDAYRDQSRSNRFHWAQNLDTRFPHQVVHSQEFRRINDVTGATNVEQLMDMPMLLTPSPRAGEGGVLTLGVTVAAQNGIIQRVTQANGSLSVFIADPVTGAPRVGQPAIFGSYFYLGEGRGSGFYELGLDGTTNHLAAMPAYGFAVAGNRMWRAHGGRFKQATYLQSIALGASITGTANWSATLNVGNGMNDVAAMISFDDQLYLGMADGLYAGDLSGTFLNVLPELRNAIHADNCRDLTIYNNSIIAPHTAGLIEFHPSQDTAVAREIGPQTTSNRSPVRGYVRAVRGYGPWLYAGLWSGSASYILAGRDTGQQTYDWHVLHRLPDTAKVHRLHLDSITVASGGSPEVSTRFWIATEASFGALTAATSPLYYYQIPRGHANPLGGDPLFSANYAASARLDYGRDDRSAPDTLKVLRRTEVNTDASTFLSGSRYADVYYALDGGARTLLGRAQTSPKSVLYYPSGDGSFVTCYDFEISLDSFSSTPASSPVYRSVVTHGAFLSQGADSITAVVDISGRRADRMGTPMRSAAMQLAELRALPGGAPVSLLDLTGAQNWVNVLRSIEESETYQEGSDEPEVAATIRMAVLSFTGNPSG